MMTGLIAEHPELRGVFALNLAMTKGAAQVLVEKSAGEASFIDDAAYRESGATIVDDSAGLYRDAEMVLRVGRPSEADIGQLREGQVLIGTQKMAEPAYAGALRPQPLQRSDELDASAAPERPFRLDLQNVGVDPGLCRKLGNETYCY